MSITFALGIHFDSNSRRCLPVSPASHAANITGFAANEAIIDVLPIAAADEQTCLGNGLETLLAYDFRGLPQQVRPAIPTLDIYVCRIESG